MTSLRSDLLVRILCDLLPLGALDAAYMFGETADNQFSVFEAAAEIYHEGFAQKILISASEPKSGYPGFGPWFNALRQMGVPEDALLGVPFPESETKMHTSNESLALMRFCREQGFQKIAVSAASFHQPRAFLSAVSAAAREHRTCRVYSFPGIPLPWEERVVHSQGIEEGTRFEFISREMEKIEIYREQGDLISDEMLAAYLENRDAQEGS